MRPGNKRGSELTVVKVVLVVVLDEVVVVVVVEGGTVVVVSVDVGVVLGVVVDKLVVIPSELSKHLLSLRCQNLSRKCE